MLLQFLDEHCMKENQKLGLENSEEADQEERIVSAFDFLYLPIDFEYVTYNLRTPELQFILRGPYYIHNVVIVVLTVGAVLG